MADLQYTIDVATEIPDGEATVAQLDALIEKLELGGRKSDSYRTAIDQLSSGLAAAKAASAAAAAELANGNDQYQILERDATRAAKAVERANAKGRVSDGLVQEAVNAKTRLDAYAATLQKLETESKSANDQQSKLEKAIKNVSAAGAKQDKDLSGEISKYRALAGVARELPGPLGRIASEHFREETALLRLGKAFGVSNTGSLQFIAAAVATTAVVAVLSAALFAGAFAFGAYAIAQANASRELALTREAFANTGADAKTAEASFDGITDATGVSADELMRLSRELIKTKQIASGQLPAALKAAALAEAALGHEGAQDFVERIKQGEVAVDEFARTAEAKFGGVVEKKLLGLGEQGARLGRLWKHMFDGFNLDPVLQAVQILVNMFDKANPLAQFLAFVFQKAFDSISGNAVSAAYAFEAFALDAAIDVLKVYLFFRKYGALIEDVLLGISIALATAAVAWGVINAGVVAEFAATAAAAVASGAAAAAAWFVAALPAIAFIAAVASVGVAIGLLIYKWSEFKEGVQLIWSDLTTWLGTKVDAFVQIGSDLIAGFVRGITGAIGSVIKAVSDTVGAGVTAAKEALGIHSPSRVFGDIGDNTVEGYTNAVDAGAPEAQGSMAALVDPSNARSGSAAHAPVAVQPASAQARGGARIDLAGATFNFHGVKDASHARDMIAEVFTRLLEDDAMSLAGAAAQG